MISLWFSLFLFMLPIVWVAYCYDTKKSDEKIVFQILFSMVFALFVLVMHVVKWLSE